MDTLKFKLLSGVECEISKFIGKHQRYFTQTEYTKDSKGAHMAIASIIVKLGSKTSVTEEEVSKMLAQDIKQILIQARIHSLKRHKTFKFDYKHTNEKGQQIKTPMELDVDANDFDTKPYKKQFTEYDEIWKMLKNGGKWASVVLEDSGLEVEFKPLDGGAEASLNAIPKKSRSSHTLVSVHKPVHLLKAEGKKDKEGALVNLNLDNLSMDDIEDLRLAIKEEEGFQDTVAVFENPQTDADDEVDVLQIPAFFFPSNAM